MYWNAVQKHKAVFFTLSGKWQMWISKKCCQHYPELSKWIFEIRWLHYELENLALFWLVHVEQVTLISM